MKSMKTEWVVLLIMLIGTFTLLGDEGLVFNVDQVDRVLKVKSFNEGMSNSNIILEVRSAQIIQELGSIFEKSERVPKIRMYLFMAPSEYLLVNPKGEIAYRLKIWCSAVPHYAAKIFPSEEADYRVLRLSKNVQDALMICVPGVIPGVSPLNSLSPKN